MRLLSRPDVLTLERSEEECTIFSGMPERAEELFRERPAECEPTLKPSERVLAFGRIRLNDGRARAGHAIEQRGRVAAPVDCFHSSRLTIARARDARKRARFEREVRTAGRRIVEEIARIERVVVEKSVHRTVQSVRARLRNRIDLRTGVAPAGRVPQAREHLKLLHTLYALRDQRNETLPPHADVFIIIVGAVYGEIV